MSGEIHQPQEHPPPLSPVSSCLLAGLGVSAALVGYVIAPFALLIYLPPHLRVLAAVPFLICARYVLGNTWVESVVLLLIPLALVGAGVLLIRGFEWL